MDGYLMSGDTAVARIERDHLSLLRPGLLPLYLAGHDDLTGWLESRAIDRHRPNSRILKKVLRLAETDDLHTVLRAHGATITDNYWIRTDDEPCLTYEEIRFGENLFADLALTGRFDSYNRTFTAEELRRSTPELTNIGSYEKCWRLEDGAWYLYKQGNALERFSELFVAGLAAILGFSSAEYEEAGRYIRTRDFTRGVYNFEPAASIVGDNEDYGFNFEKISALSPELVPQYLDMLCLDALCFNMDRHTYNYGFLREQSTGRVAAMAPNFDNNVALIARGYGAEPEGSNGLLIDLFVELLRDKGIAYAAPALGEEQVASLAAAILPEEEIDREYVRRFISDRHQRLGQQLHALGFAGPSFIQG